MNLLTINHDSKTPKGAARGYITGIMYLAPHKISGVANLCANASPGCILGCLYHKGRAGVFPPIKRARIARTKLFKTDRQSFMIQLAGEIAKLSEKAKRDSKKAAIRLNGTSDVAWERVKLFGKTLFEIFPDLVFYDYTKSRERAKSYACGNMPANYHLTFSRSETNGAGARSLARLFGGNVAVVFRGQAPKTLWGLPVFNGDQDDLRFLDPPRHIIAPKAKGDPIHDKSGFGVDGGEK